MHSYVDTCWHGILPDIGEFEHEMRSKETSDRRSRIGHNVERRLIDDFDAAIGIAFNGLAPENHSAAMANI